MLPPPPPPLFAEAEFALITSLSELEMPLGGDLLRTKLASQLPGFPASRIRVVSATSPTGAIMPVRPWSISSVVAPASLARTAAPAAIVSAIAVVPTAR